MVLYWSLLWPSAIAVASASRAVASRAVAPAVPFLIHRSAAVSPPPRLAGAVSKREVVLDDANLQGVTIYGAGSFETADELEAKLFEMGVDVASWGDGKAKTCKALFTELELGESVLRYTESDGVVLREVRVVKVRIQRPDAPNESLVEARQIFADGRERARGTPLSEKVLLWEGPVAAARRGVLEELGPALGPRASSILIDDASLTAWEETRQSSSSYPTLATRYLLHQVDAATRCKSFADHPLSTSLYDSPVMCEYATKKCDFAPHLPAQPGGGPPVEVRHRDASCAFRRFVGVDNAAHGRLKPSYGYGIAAVGVLPSLDDCEARCCADLMCHSVVWLAPTRSCIALLTIAHGARRDDFCWRPTLAAGATTSVRLPG
ncbi:hypothetical protein Ctob_002803 [Chrysochromulina tobinii]|uniref:Apple domain-containing protein n=1 Tax=Chrysochromulina tobinii TaxID=1460289 RepID=A0A0M0JG02_9EUKA|nr:hypothetical protein Ctob_002803 [Chrysochromulina tobinii]|eukprot:KOO25494.1 hypothetical protein Ctob_002803 [Chrysochromulina sp. CCMP291]